MGKNIIPHHFSVTAEMREKLNGHKGLVLWFTGLSGSGKSTIAHALDLRLNRAGIHTYVLDGDNIRCGLNSDLGFSPEARAENIRRIGEAAALFADAGLAVITAFISPYRSDRAAARKKVPDGRFFEVYISCPLETAESRDPKGLYKKARAGGIEEFTGISAPYEPPEEPEITIDTSLTSVDEAVELVFNEVIKNISM